MLSPESIRLQLNEILSSKPFAMAARSRRFLTYIVEQTLAGEGDKIKEAVLGVEVFDRPADFDPRVDAIVRVEAGKLRKRLEQYYEGEGEAAPLRIEIPKGAYVPQFRPSSTVQALDLFFFLRAPRVRYAAIALLALIALFASWAAWQLRHPSAPVEPSIAVLPFLNISPDPSNDYLADGLAEELTDALSRAGGMRVASRTSAFFFKGRQSDVSDVGAKLRVAFVVEGSVRRQGDHLRLTAQLIRTGDGYHVWSGSFEGRLQDLFKVQQETAASIVSALQVRLTGTQSRRLRKTHTASQPAFDLYLRGRHASTGLVPSVTDPAEGFFRQSIAADPAYALPYVALATLYMNENILSDRPARELFSQAKDAINRALALDDELAEAYAIRGSLTARHEYNWQAAEHDLRHALELDPNSGFTHYLLAQYVLAPVGRLQEALAENHRAIELDPFSRVIAGGQPWLVYLDGRNDEAIEGFRKLLAAEPADPAPLIGLGSALMAKGDFQAAGDAFERLHRAFPSSLTLARIAYNHGRAGHVAEARQILRQLQADSKRRFVSPGCFAIVYTGLGEKDDAFRYLEIAREQQESFLIFSRVSSFLAPLQSDPRYGAFLAELGLGDKSPLSNQPVTTGVNR